jgi:hypothetical protein
MRSQEDHGGLDDITGEEVHTEKTESAGEQVGALGLKDEKVHGEPEGHAGAGRGEARGNAPAARTLRQVARAGRQAQRRMKWNFRLLFSEDFNTRKDRGQSGVFVRSKRDF